MAGTSVVQLVGAMNDMLIRISKAHELEMEQLRKENNLLLVELNSARAKSQQGESSSDGNPQTSPAITPCTPCTDSCVASSPGNSRRTSRSSRRTSSLKCISNAMIQLSDLQKEQDRFPAPLRRTKAVNSMSSLELRKVQIAARQRVARASDKHANTQEQSAHKDFALPNLLASRKIQTKGTGSEDPPSSESSEDEAVGANRPSKTSADVIDQKDTSLEKWGGSHEKPQAIWQSQGSSDFVKDQCASEIFSDNDDVELCVVWRSQKRNLGRIARRALTPLTSVDSAELQCATEDVWQGVHLQTPTRLYIRVGQVLHNFWKIQVARPSSKRRLLWDFMGMLLIGYDLIMIPLSAFDPPTNAFTALMAWTCTLYWTLDIPSTLVVGYHSKGVLEMRPLRIVIQYARTWLAFDLCVLAVDWMCVFAENFSGSGRNRVGYLRFGRFGRFLRMLRLLRLLKLHGMLTDIMDRINSEFARIVLGMVNMLVFIVLINHVLACGWYWVGTQCFELSLPSWVVAAELADRSMAYNYTTSVHWSLTQFTPASMEVVALNAVERTYTVCTLLFAMCTFSSFVSSITNAMTRLRTLNSDNVNKATVLRQFLKENRIPGEVCNRIWAWLHYAEDSSRCRTHEHQVAILPTLPAFLQTEVHHSIYKPLLDKHPWFAKFSSAHPEGMRGLYACLVEVGLAIGKELFNCGQVADRMWFVFSGNLRYLRDDELKNQSWRIKQLEDVYNQYASIGDLSDRKSASIIGPGQWASEHPLWIQWHHVGQLVGLSHAELFAIKAQKFQELMRDDHQGIWQAVKYAKAFYNALICNQDALTDVWQDPQLLNEMATHAFTLSEDDVLSSSSEGTTCSPVSSRRQSTASHSSRLSRQSTHSHSWNSRMSQGAVRKAFGTPSQTFSSPVFQS